MIITIATMLVTINYCNNTIMSQGFLGPKDIIVFFFFFFNYKKYDTIMSLGPRSVIHLGISVFE